jgi:hypothetical protein
MKEGGTAALSSDATAQILRSVVNLSAVDNGACKANLLANGWYDKLIEVALDPSAEGRLALAAFTALGNLASDEQVSRRLAQQDIPRLRNQLINNSKLSQFSNKTVLEMQFARLCLQAARVDFDAVSKVVSLKELLETATLEVPSTSTRAALMSMLSKFAQNRVF